MDIVRLGDARKVLRKKGNEGVRRENDNGRETGIPRERVDDVYLRLRDRCREMVQDLIHVRGKWVEDYMQNWLHETIDNDLALLKEVYHIEVDKSHELEEVELLHIQEVSGDFETNAC